MQLQLVLFVNLNKYCGGTGGMNNWKSKASFSKNTRTFQKILFVVLLQTGPPSQEKRKGKVKEFFSVL